MTHYVAFVDEEPGCAVGVWFPDLPGCYSAGDDIDEAMLNAREAIALWAEGREHPMPRARSILEIRNDPEQAEDVKLYTLVLIPFVPDLLAVAAE